MILIGLGNAGCKVVEGFSDSHKKITIDAGSELNECSSPELYEQEAQKAKHLFEFDEDECYFFVCGAGKVSAATLALLETINTRKSILFISIRKKLCCLRYNKSLTRLPLTFFKSMLALACFIQCILCATKPSQSLYPMSQ